jgi:F0F1-type ATP synthase assembly protein I
MFALSLREVLNYVRKQGALYPLVFGGLIAFSFNMYAIQSWFPALLSRTYGLTPRQISIFYGVPYLVGGVAGALIAGAIIRFLDSRGRTDSSVLVCQWTTILALVPAILGPLSHRPAVAIACATTVIFLAAIQHSTAFTTYVLVTPEGMRGQIIAAHVMAMNVFSATLSGIVVGLLSDHVFGAARLGSGLSVVGILGMPIAAVLYSLLRPVYRNAVARQLAATPKLQITPLHA